MDQTKDRIFLAIACCLAAHLCFTIMGATAKYLADTHHVVEIAFYRNLIVFIPFLAFLVLSRKYHLFKTKRKKLVAFRAICGGFSLIITFAAISHLPLSYTTVLFFTSSILTPILAFLFLKEQVGWHRWGAVALGMTGVFIIAQPSGAFSLIGLALALCAACLHAIMYTTLRSLKYESPLTVTFYFILAGTLIPAMGMPWLASSIHSDEIWAFLLVGVAGGSAQIFLANAYKYAPASVVTPFAYSALLYNILIDVYIWHYTLDFISVLAGASLVLTAQLYIMHREYMHHKKAQQ